MKSAKWLSLFNVAVFVISAVIGAGAVGIFFLYPVENSGDVAAWAQAIGSISAIGAAIWIGVLQNRGSRELLNKQFRQDERNRKEANIGSLQSMAEIGRIVAVLVINSCGAISDVSLNRKKEAGQISTALKDGLKLLESFRLETVPGVFIAKSILDLKYVIKQFLSVLSTVEDSVVASEDQLRVLQDICTSANALKEALLERAGEYPGDWPIYELEDF